MTYYPKFRQVAVTPKIVSAGHVECNVREIGEVWLNSFGVNAVRPYPSEGEQVKATIIDMDDGTQYVVSETPNTVVNRLSKSMRERDEVM